jgi:hypothetical protein
MTNPNYITDSEKEKIINKMHERYNPDSIGQIEKYPPHGDYFVTLYHKDNYSVKVSNWYNVTIGERPHRFLVDFEISNINKVGNELKITLKVTKQ